MPVSILKSSKSKALKEPRTAGREDELTQKAPDPTGQGDEIAIKELTDSNFPLTRVSSLEKEKIISQSPTEKATTQKEDSSSSATIKTVPLKLPSKKESSRKKALPDPKPLEMEMITPGLSDLRRNLVNGKYTFSKLVADGKGVVDISILNSFIHLRFLYLRHNKISDLKSLSSLEFLEILDVAHNCIDSAANIPMFKHLKILNLSRNKLKTIVGFMPNFITHLNLRGNVLDTLEGMSNYFFPNLTHLDVRGNYLSSLKHMQLPRLEELYAAQNQISSLTGLQKSPMLKSIHLRANKIMSLREFPSFVKLNYLNLRDNRICRFTEMTYLMHSPNIQVLVLKGNPITESLRYRAEIIATLNQVRRLDKHFISSAELETGREIFRGRMRGHVAPLMDDSDVSTPPATAGRSEIEIANAPGSRGVPPNSAVNKPLDLDAFMKFIEEELDEKKE